MAAIALKAYPFSRIPVALFIDHLAPFIDHPLTMGKVCREWRSCVSQFLTWNRYTLPHRNLFHYTNQAPKRLSCDKARILWLIQQVKRDAEGAYIRVQLSVKMLVNPYCLQTLSLEITRRKNAPHPALHRMICGPVYTDFGMRVPVLKTLPEQTSFKEICDAVGKRLQQLQNGIRQNQHSATELKTLCKIQNALIERMAQIWENWDGPPQKR